MIFYGTIKREFYFGFLGLLILAGIFSSGVTHGQTLEFETVLEQVIAKSYDLRIAEIDMDIGGHKLVEAISEYYPSLSLRFYSEYDRDLSDVESGVASVGDNVFTGDGGVMYKDSLSLNMNYNLYDFGLRDKMVDNALRDVKIADFNVDQQLMDIRARVLTIYQKGLTLCRKMRAQSAILNCRKKIYTLVKRLCDAGNAGKFELAGKAIDLAEAVQDMDGLQLEWENTLQELSAYTGERYDAENDEFTDFREPVLSEKTPKVRDMPSIRIYDLEIEKKQAEYEANITEWLPKISLYSSYRFYGSDPSTFSESFQDIHETDYIAGIMFDLNLFRGFGDRAKGRRLRSELGRLKIEREKKIVEQESLVNMLKADLRIYKRQKEKWDDMREEISAWSKMSGRLAEQKVKDRIFFIDQEIERIERVLEIEVKNIDRIATLYRMRFLAGKGPGERD